MANEFCSRTNYYRQWVEDCLAMAKAATSNKTRAELYTAAEYYSHLGEVEENLTAAKSEPGHVPQI
jgi:hypothetical protein